MFQDLSKVLDQVSKDKGISREVLIEAVEAAMLTAARKKYGQVRELEARFNEEIAEVEIFQFRTVAEEVMNELTQVSPAEAAKLDPDAQIGDSIGEKLDNKFLGRIAAQTAKQVIIQKVRDAERDIIFTEFKDRVGELITGIVRRIEKRNLIIDLGRTEAIIPVREQVPTENYRLGERIQAYLMTIDRAARGPQLILSRRSPALVTKLFEMEVPEISEKIVTIKKIAREPGARAKIAVYSKDSDVDPVGACVGMKGSRVQSVVQELKGEKIDIVEWDEDSAKFICNAIAPAEVAKVIIREHDHSMELIVPDDQLSLAIGKKGQNVRLAAELAGWNIDIYSETKLDEMAREAKKVLVEALGVDEGTSTILYSQAFRTPAEIAEASFEELQQIPGFSKDRLEEFQAKAKAYLKRKKEEKLAGVPELKPVETVKIEEVASASGETKE